MTFDEFKSNCLDGFKNGYIKVSAPLSELDMAVQYVCGIEWEKGNKTLTSEDIASKVIEYCGYFPDESKIFWDPTA